MQATRSGTDEVRREMTLGRYLQQASPVVTSVTTGKELIDAVVDGAQHIRIEQHLDLTLPSFDTQINPISDADTPHGNSFNHTGYIDTTRTDTVMVSHGAPDRGPLSGKRVAAQLLAKHMARNVD